MFISVVLNSIIISINNKGNDKEVSVDVNCDNRLWERITRRIR